MADPLSIDGLPAGHVLVVDDDADVQHAARLLLERNGWRVSSAIAPAQIWGALAGVPVDAVLLDLNFTRGARTGEEGLRALAQIMAHDPQAVVVVVTGHSGVTIAVEAMRAGASDFVMKPWNNARLLATLDAARERRAASRRANASARPDPGETPLLGESAAMARVRERIARAATTDAAVLIYGAAGTGKSLIARQLHRASARADGAFACVDLAASTVDEAARALFDTDNGGAWGQAQGGTLVLDGVEALAPGLQTRLASRLDIASTQVRLVSTTRRRPSELAGRGGVRDDLLYRLNTIELAAPPLRERGDDARLLAEHFLALFAQRHGRAPKPLTAAAAQWIVASDWPGEVRALRQAMERCVIFSEGPAYEVDDLVARDSPAPAAASRLNLAQSERSLVAAALERHAFNVSHAAKDLGLTRAALYRRMAKHGL